MSGTDKHCPHLDPKLFPVILEKALANLGMPITYSQIGGGACGIAYKSNNRVYKITTDKSEAIESNKLIGKNNQHIANIYNVKRINTTLTNVEVYLIVLEYLDIGKSSIFLEIEEELLEMVKIVFNENLFDIIYTYQRDPATYNNVYAEGMKGIFDTNPREKFYYNSLLKIVDELKANNIDSLDIQYHNLGLKPNGNLAFFDLGFGDTKDTHIGSVDIGESIEFINLEGEKDFKFSDDLGGVATGYIENDTATIYSMNSVPFKHRYGSEESKYKRRGFFRSLISELKKNGVKTVKISLQSNDTQKAVERLLNIGVLKNPTDITGSSGNEHPTKFEISERVKSYMKNSSAVKVADKCKFGGNPDGTSNACNKGDISNFKFSKINEGQDKKIEYGAVMLKIPIKNWSKITNEIDKSDIYDLPTFGVEDDPHVTALYGLHNDVTIDDVKEKISSVFDFGDEIEIELIGVSHFETPKYDVVKFDVESKTLRLINKKLKELPFTTDYPDYKPHMTISYVKSGTGKKYDVKLKKPIKLKSNKLVYSQIDKEKPTLLTERRVKRGDRDDIYRDGEVIVVRPLTFEASCKYGAHTSWCTSAPSNEYIWTNNPKSVLIYIIQKNYNVDPEKDKNIGRFLYLKDKEDNGELTDEKEIEEYQELAYRTDVYDLSKIAISLNMDNISNMAMFDANNVEITDLYDSNYYQLPINSNAKEAIHQYVINQKKSPVLNEHTSRWNKMLQRKWSELHGQEKLSPEEMEEILRKENAITVSEDDIRAVVEHELSTMVEAIDVYHGTMNPKFDSFSTNKIGSSNTREMGGWGIYVTTDPDVARQYGNNLITAQIPNGSYLDLDDRIDDHLAQYVVNYGSKLGIPHSAIEEFKRDFISDEYIDHTTNYQVLEWLKNVFVDSKKAMNFINKAGFIGTKFNDKTNPDAINYVIFDPRNVKIINNDLDEKMNEQKEVELSDLPFKNDVEKAGGKLYSVGGAVRDRLLGKESKDLDILITGIPLDQLESILSKYGKVDSVGKSFGIIKFNTPQTGEIDIAIPRTERKNDQGGYQGFDVTSDHTLPIEKDLERRDFTINAIAKDSSGLMIDPYGGQGDIEKKQIKMVNPQAFSDDPLRMLRAVQFAARFGFDIEPQTLASIQKNASKINEISPERILIEFDKIVKKGNQMVGAKLLRQTGLYNYIFGVNRGINLAYFKYSRTMGEFIFGLIGDAVNNPAEFYKTKLKGDLDTYNELRALEIGDEFTGNRKTVFDMYKIYPKSIDTAVFGGEFKNVVQYMRSKNIPFSLKEVPVNGNDIMELGYTGKGIGEVLVNVLNKIYKEELPNEREAILNYIKSL